jgi:hypothetical protein
MRQECSFRQWLSVYYDGEMYSPWKEKMEAHIAGCADCKEQLEAYKKISLSLAPAEDIIPDEAQRRVLQKLETSGHFSSYENRPAWSPPVWKRRVSIPIPAAAAVVFMFIALAFLWIRSPGRLQKTNAVNMAITAETEILPDDFLPVAGYPSAGNPSMETVLQYLGGNDTGEIIILRLPESRKFSSYGEPSIIRAADYSPNMPKGRK